MSPSAIFVFLLVSALHMLECILDLVKRVGANCQENSAFSSLSLSHLVQDYSFGEKYLILDELRSLRMNLHGGDSASVIIGSATYCNSDIFSARSVPLMLS
jgi:hypothetical protein